MDKNKFNDLFQTAIGITTVVENIKQCVNENFDYYWRRLQKLPSVKVKENVVKDITTKISIVYPIYMQDKGFKLERTQMDMDKIIKYTYHYLAFYTGKLSDSERVEKYKDEAYINGLASEICNDIFFNEELSISLTAETSEYSPLVVGFNTLCKLLLKYIAVDIAVNDLDFKGKHLNKLFQQAFGMVQSCLMLAANGLASDAVALWRTLHELECVLILLSRYEEGLIKKYIAHQKYYDLEIAKENNLANGQIEQLKLELERERSLYKPKPAEKPFINYGWLLPIKEYRESGRPLAFKGGLQDFAGQGDRATAYVTACKASHPTAVTLIRRQSKFFVFLIAQLYESMANLVDCALTYIRYCKPSFGESDEEVIQTHCDRLNERYLLFMEKYSNLPPNG